MTEESVPQNILIATGHVQASEEDLETRSGSFISRIFNRSCAEVDITQLQNRINVFIQQFDHVMQDTPEKVGKFCLAEFEVSAGIVIGLKGEVSLALLASAEANSSANAAFKFVFRKL